MRKYSKRRKKSSPRKRNRYNFQCNISQIHISFWYLKVQDTSSDESQCPGDGLHECIEVCPSSNLIAFKVCVNVCVRRCPWKMTKNSMYNFKTIRKINHYASALLSYSICVYLFFTTLGQNEYNFND